MSATDINLDVSYFDWPEVKRLAGILGRGTEALPLRIWAHCGAVHYADGRLTAYTAAEIEAIVDWRGQPGKAVEALVKVGFLRALDGPVEGYEVMYRGEETWLDRNGHIAAYKAKGRAMARAKHAKVRSEASGDASFDPPPDDSRTGRATDSITASSENKAPQSCLAERATGERRSGGGDHPFQAQQQRQQRTPRAPENHMVVAGFRPSGKLAGDPFVSGTELTAGVTDRLAAAAAVWGADGVAVARARAERGMLARRVPFGGQAGLRVQDLSAERARWYLTDFSGRDNLDPHLRAALELRVAQWEQERAR